MAQPTTTLPTFFVIGAPKCGTTSLHSYLDEHPSISMSSEKEPWVFARTDFRERVADYTGMFDAGAPVRGESSAVYALHPFFPCVPDRIAQTVPDARFVYVVGDPIRRAVSHHAQRVTDGTEPRDLGAAFSDLDAAANVYVAGSSYATQLKRYLEVFPPESLLVIDQDALRSKTAATLAEIFEFLDVNSDIPIAGIDKRLNAREDHRVATPLGDRLKGGTVYERVRSLPIPHGVRNRLRALTSRGLGRPDLDSATRARLASVLESEVVWLRSFANKSFPGWSL